MAAEANGWLQAHPEDHTGRAADLNQYWYSSATIATLVGVVREHVLRVHHGCAFDCAFVSTPSLFFSLTAAERAGCRLLEYDETLCSADGCVRFDFHRPTALPQELRGAFKCVVIDPPFITRDVWQLYAQTARHLLPEEGGLLVLTTVIENAPMLAELLDARPNVYLPSIPNLPYQYSVYTNFKAPLLDSPNPEVPHDPAAFLASANAATASEAEVPLKGAGHAYDFEAMIEAELRRQGAASA